MSQKQTDANNCYMDSVRVKISEKYKPPPKITIAMTYAQRLTMNRQLQENMPSYNFQTDACVKEKMKEWRSARSTIASERQHKLEMIKHDEERRKAIEVENVNEADSNKMQEETSNERLGSMLIPTQANIAPQKLQNTDDASPINISDFEPDSSSPFDNLELKTLNDMEELKIVLQNDDKNKYQPLNDQTSYAPSHNTYYNYMPTSSSHAYASNTHYASTTSTTNTNGYAPYYANTTSSTGGSGGYAYRNYNGRNDYANTIATSTTMANGMEREQSQSTTVPDIIKSLQNLLNLNTPSQTQRTRSDSNNSATSLPNIVVPLDLDNHEHERLENPYANLPVHSQAICESIAIMGFPLARVARACKVLGDDEKKIVEYLLSMSQLMDLGFSEETVASALSDSDNDRDKALEVLIS